MRKDPTKRFLIKSDIVKPGLKLNATNDYHFCRSDWWAIVSEDISLFDRPILVTLCQTGKGLLTLAQALVKIAGAFARLQHFLIALMPFLDNYSSKRRKLELVHLSVPVSGRVGCQN